MKISLVFIIVGILYFCSAVSGNTSTTANSQQENDICLPHSPRVNCSFLPLQFLECDPLVDNKGNASLHSERGYGCLKFGGQRYEDVEVGRAKCKVLEGIDCCGKREFFRDGFPCIKYSNHYFVTTLIYSLLLGFLGMDRFCLGHTGTAVGKLLTLGGVGIWWLVDIVLLVAGSLVPKDEKMAQISYNSIKKHRYREGNLENECDPQKASGDSLRDIILKNVVSNHLKRNLSLSDCFTNKEKFIKATKLEEPPQNPGFTSYDDYIKSSKVADLREILRNCHLEPEEIDILTNKNDKCWRYSEDFYTKMLSSIEEKLNSRQRELEDNSIETFTGAIALSRLEFEEEYSKVTSKSAERLSKCLVKLEPKISKVVAPDHPINCLQILEKNLFADSTVSTSQTKQISKKKRNCDSTHEVKTKIFLEKPDTFWDMKELPIVHSGFVTPRIEASKQRTTNLIINSASEQGKPTTDFSKPFVWSIPASQLIPLSTIAENKMEMHKIKSDLRFANYSPGRPSSGLYIKNLPPKLDPLSLVSLFAYFEEDNDGKIEYRLLKGKMRGQAFVKFNNFEIAAKALDLCNGYIIDGRPMIISYSKN